MSTNEYGFDYRYFERWLHRMLQGIERYTPEEAYNEFSSMAETARPKEIESLRTKLAEAEKREAAALKDAERYRWAKQQFWFEEEAMFRLDIKDSDIPGYFNHQVDKAIDAAIAKGER